MMAAFKSTLSSSVPLTDRPYDGNLIASLFAIVDRAETLSTSTAPELDPEDDIELEIRTRTAGIRIRKFASDRFEKIAVVTART